MESLPAYIETQRGIAYLQCGAYEAGWFLGYFAEAAPIPNLFIEAGTLNKCIIELRTMLALRQMLAQPTTINENTQIN